MQKGRVLMVKGFGKGIDKSKIEKWYDEECQKGTDRSSLKDISFKQKLIAYSLVMSAPLLLVGCSSDDEANVEEYSAIEECEWEEEVNGWELDCENEGSHWYATRGYKSKNSKISHSSPFYQHKSSLDSRGGVGSGGSNSGGFFSGG
jgi:hypothetical protein